MSDQENTQKSISNDADSSGMGKIGESGNDPKRQKRRICGCDNWGWWEDRSLPQKILIGIAFGVVGIAFLFLCGLIVMLLWNWLMPDIFGLKRLNYWQAWGLLVLCRILFKGFGMENGGRRSDRKRRRQLRRYMQEDQAGIGDVDENK